jgi:hypothetical protein
MRRWYGARWWHLAAVLLSFVVAAYSISRVLDDPTLFRLAVWFVGAAVVWDFVLGPLYALVDAGARRALRATPDAVVSPLNYLRVPVVLSTALLLVWTPLVFQRSEAIYRAKSGLLQDPYLERWLGVTGVLFGLSALAYVVALLRARRRAALRQDAPR